MATILSKLKDMTREEAPVLLLVDNAESVLQASNLMQREFAELLVQVCDHAKCPVIFIRNFLR